MSEKEENQDEERNLEQAQRRQDKRGEGSSNPKTTGPAENLREKAAEMNETEEVSGASLISSLIFR